MFIWLDDSIKNALATNDPLGRVGLSTVFLSILRKEHFVLANRDLLESISKCPLLADHDRKVARALASRLTEIGTLKGTFSQRITIAFDNSSAIEKTNDGWKIQLTEIARRGLRPTTLLAEDVTDVQLLVEAAKHYLIQKKLFGTLEPKPDGRGAGGKGNVWRSFAITMTKTREWCLCITDSDRLTPLCGQSSLTKHIDSVVRAHHGNSVGSHYALPTRELENLVPRSLVSEALSTNKDAFDSWTELIGTLKTPDHILRHADLKCGSTLWSIQRLAPGSPQRKFWDDEISRISLVKGENIQCRHKVCKKSLDKNASCQCFATPPVSERMCEDVLEFQQKNSAAAVFKKICLDPNIASWLDVGRIVAEWTCGHKMNFI